MWGFDMIVILPLVRLRGPILKKKVNIKYVKVRPTNFTQESLLSRLNYLSIVAIRKEKICGNVGNSIYYVGYTNRLFRDHKV